MVQVRRRRGWRSGHAAAGGLTRNSDQARSCHCTNAEPTKPREGRWQPGSRSMARGVPGACCQRRAAGVLRTEHGVRKACKRARGQRSSRGGAVGIGHPKTRNAHISLRILLCDPKRRQWAPMQRSGRERAVTALRQSQPTNFYLNQKCFFGGPRVQNVARKIVM